MTPKIAAAVFVLAGTCLDVHRLDAHRLDEYLQGTLISVEKNRVDLQLTLTPGVAVFPFLIAGIDRDADGAISAAEQRTYAGRVLRDLSLLSDGREVMPRLLSMRFPAIDEMKEGRGEIRMVFTADLPRGGRNRSLTLENRHQPGIAAYQVNCLLPQDPNIRIVAQRRNYSQSVYRLEYEDAGVGPGAFPGWSGGLIGLGAIALLLAARFTALCRTTARKLSHFFAAFQN